jgi:hypothetical protein
VGLKCPENGSSIIQVSLFHYSIMCKLVVVRYLKILKKKYSLLSMVNYQRGIEKHCHPAPTEQEDSPQKRMCKVFQKHELGKFSLDVADSAIYEKTHLIKLVA